MDINREIKVIAAKNGSQTIIVNSISLHSKYNPESEAKTFLDSNQHVFKDKNTILVYGMGLGYHIEELLNRVSPETSIHVFDIDEEVTKVVKNTTILDKILMEKRLHFYYEDNKYFYKALLTILNKVEDILIYKPSLQILPDKYTKLKNILKGYELSKIGLNKFGSIMNKNYELNLNESYKPIEEFLLTNTFNNEPVIIVSAGPSLNDSIEDLRLLQNKIKIFSVGSALRQLKSTGIKPHMTAIIDPQEIVYEQLKGYEDLNIPLCFLSTASHMAVSKYNGPKYMFYNEKNGENKVIDTGKSVATALLSIAIEGGADPIIFVGQDLAFVNNQDHCSLYPHGVKGIRDEINYKKVEGVDGNLLNTTYGLLYFKYWIEEKISQHKEIKFINCSKGAKITGTIISNLSEFISS